MLKAFRGVCLICFCGLGIALIVAILEVCTLPIILAETGCQANFEILPNFTCGEGLVRHSIETILNLPFLARNFRLLLYLFDAILFLALTYPLLFLLVRKRARPSS